MGRKLAFLQALAKSLALISWLIDTPVDTLLATPIHFQAGNAIRTRDIHLGKVTLYH